MMSLEPNTVEVTILSGPSGPAGPPGPVAPAGEVATVDPIARAAIAGLIPGVSIQRHSDKLDAVAAIIGPNRVVVTDADGNPIEMGEAESESLIELASVSPGSTGKTLLASDTPDQSRSAMGLPGTPSRYLRNDGSGVPSALGAGESANLDVLSAGNFSPLLSTRASAVIMTLTAYSTVRVKAWDGSSPLAEAQYDKVASEPSHSGKFQDAAGNWFELRSPLPDQYMFGAIGDGVADDTAALARLEAFAQATGIHYRYKPGTHKITSRLDLQASGDMSAATINFDGSTMAVGIRFGSVTPGEYVGLNKSLWWRGPKVVNTGKSGPGWSGGNATCIGIQLSNLYEVTAWLATLVGCGVGVDCTAYSTGFVYNKIHFSKFENCKVSHRCKPGDATSWINENLFVGGRFHFDSNEGTNTAGTRHILTEGYDKGGGVLHNPPNSNVWLHPSIEGNTPEYHVEMCGFYNTIAWARWEATPPKVAFYSEVAEGSAYNTILGGYTAHKIVLSSLGQYTRYNYVIDGTRAVLEASGNANLPAVTGSSNLGNTEATPWLQLFSASKQFLAGTDNTATDWMVRLAANGLSAKAAADAYARYRLRGDIGRVYLGDGTADPTAYIAYNGATTQINVIANGGFGPLGDNNMQNGRSTARWSRIYATEIRPGAGSVIWTSGSGSPEGVVTAPVGSIYLRTDGGAGTTFYVKESGAGNTGWIAK